MMLDFVQELHEIFQSKIDLIEMENRLLRFVESVMNDLFLLYIKQYEPALIRKYQADGYTIKKKAERSVTFLFGQLTYTRTALERNGHIIYPIDDVLGVERYSRYSVGTKHALVQLSTVISYRKSSEMIEILTNVNASKDTVMKVVHEYEEKYKEHQEYLEEYGEEGTRQVEYLYIEGDGVLIGGKDGKNKELAHFIVHEGIETVGKRNMTKNLVQIIGLGHKKTLNQLEDYLYRTYDLRNTIIVTNSDGGKGYSQRIFKGILPVVNRHEHFLDRYHISQKLEQRVFIPELIPIFQRAINHYSLEEVKSAMDTLEAFACTKEHDNHVQKLRGYLRRNWKIIKPYPYRDLQGKKEGIGIMESLHRTITYRMKRNGKYWGKGLESMAWLLTTKRNGTLKEIFLEKWKEEFSLDDRLVAESGKIPNHYFEDERAKTDTEKTYSVHYKNSNPRYQEKLKWYRGT
ncbi:ISLre2 family transposase [Enterococcus hirae]